MSTSVYSGANEFSCKTRFHQGFEFLSNFTQNAWKPNFIQPLELRYVSPTIFCLTQQFAYLWNTYRGIKCSSYKAFFAGFVRLAASFYGDSSLRCRFSFSRTGFTLSYKNAKQQYFMIVRAINPDSPKVIVNCIHQMPSA
ncbi:hypothetical protein NIES2098_28930 [Calothrix sp. NIES-2098]|nr:hypothetical protein NIES2098_28930 [Calothrix sp. NIES-2098]